MLPPLQTNLSHVVMMLWHGERRATQAPSNRICSLLKLLSGIHKNAPGDQLQPYGMTCYDLDVACTVISFIHTFNRTCYNFVSINGMYSNMKQLSHRRNRDA